MRRVSGFWQGATPNLQKPDEIKETMRYYALLFDMVLHRWWKTKLKDKPKLPKTPEIQVPLTVFENELLRA